MRNYKCIYISSSESQSITNFTFWKIILIEIHKVHLLQDNILLGYTSEMYVLFWDPSNESFTKLFSKLILRRSQFREVWVNFFQKLYSSMQAPKEKGKCDPVIWKHFVRLKYKPKSYGPPTSLSWPSSPLTEKCSLTFLT